MKAKKYRRPKFSHGDTNADKLSCLSFLIFDICFVHPIFSSFGFSHFGHFSYFLSVFFLHLALQNVNKDYIIFSYFGNFVAKTDEKQKMERNKQYLLYLLFRAIRGTSQERSFPPVQSQPINGVSNQ